VGASRDRLSFELTTSHYDESQCDEKVKNGRKLPIRRSPRTEQSNVAILRGQSILMLYSHSMDILDRKGLMGWVCLSVCHASTAALGKPYV
jgi:hypothetical protein